MGCIQVFRTGKNEIKEGWLLFIFFLLVIADVIVVAVWFVMDPLRPKETVVGSTLNDDTSVRTITVMIVCESTNKTYFLIATLCFKAIVLLLGGFIVWPALFMSIKKGYAHFSVFALAVFASLLVCIVLVVISFLIPNEPNSLFIIYGSLILFTTILTTLLIFIPKATVIARGGDRLSQKLFSPIGAAFGFLETVAGEGQMPGLGASMSLKMPGVHLAAGQIETDGQKSALYKAYHHQGGGQIDTAGQKTTLYKAYHHQGDPRPRPAVSDKVGQRTESDIEAAEHVNRL